MAEQRGALVACVHGLLNHAVYRFLDDNGIAAWALILRPSPMLGSRISPRVVPASPLQLRDAQRVLRQGGVLCAMLDRSEPSKRSVDLALRRGSLRINDAMFRVAALAGARVVFCSTRVDERYRIVLTWYAPDPASDLAGIVVAFWDFLGSTLQAQRELGSSKRARGPIPDLTDASAHGERAA